MATKHYCGGAAILLWLLGMVAPSALQAQPAFKLQLEGRWIEGTPLVATEKQVFLLARDGQIWDFNPSQVQNYSQSSGNFYGYSMGELRGQLMKECGSRYEVSGSGHYLVVHPAGQKDLWAPRFEDLYRSF